MPIPALRLNIFGVHYYISFCWLLFLLHGLDLYSNVTAIQRFLLHRELLFFLSWLLEIKVVKLSTWIDTRSPLFVIYLFTYSFMYSLNLFIHLLIN
jgi:hypothetical protein